MLRMNQSSSKQAKTIDAFIAGYPADVQTKLQELRQAVSDSAPDATEKISYGIPTFYLKGNLVHFSAYPSHIGFYPGALAIKHFAKQLESYQTSKGTVQFPIDKPLPLPLIEEVVRFRVKQNLSK